MFFKLKDFKTHVMNTSNPIKMLTRVLCLFTASIFPCLMATPKPLPHAPAHHRGEPFRIVAYFSGWGPVSKIKFDYITTLDFAFLKPMPDATIATNDTASYNKLYDIVAKAHAAHVKVIASIGGQYTDKTFGTISASPDLTRKFVQTLLDQVDKYHLDGIDLDWEYPSLTDNGVESGHQLDLIKALSTALHARGKELTAAVAAKPRWGALVLDATVSMLDYINIMDYDQVEDPTRLNHSSYAFAVEGLNYWIRDRHVPSDKCVLGVPTYGRAKGVVPPYYHDLIDHGADPNADSLTSAAYKNIPVYYNGKVLMAAKTELALRECGGIMIWEVNGDTDDPETSLIHVIAEKAKGKMIREKR